MTLIEDTRSPNFTKKTILADANTGVVEGEKYVTVQNHFNGSYSFTTILELQPEKNIWAIASWKAQAEAEGNYTITLSAIATQAHRTGEEHRLDQTSHVSKKVEALKGAPRIEEIYISPIYDFDHTKTLPPNQNITVKCNVSSYPGVKNVTLYWISYPVGSSPPQTWNRLPMIKSQGDEWMNLIPGQPEGLNVTIFIEAFSLIDVSSMKFVGRYEVVDLGKVEFKTKITGLAIVTVLIAGCLGILVIRRRKVSEEL